MSADQPPVFILGLHRSGTTLLYQLLGGTGRFSTLTAWHVIHFDALRRGLADVAESRARLTDRFQELGVADRMIDAIAVSADTPEEYAFILDNVAGDTRLTENNLATFSQICEIVQHTNPARHRPLLKNPFDFARGDRILEIIPDARLIFIHRHPRCAVGSLFRMVRDEVLQPSSYLAMLSDRYRRLVENRPLLSAMRYVVGNDALLARFLVRYTSRRISRYLRARSRVATLSAIDVTYEELCQAPNRVIEHILLWLGEPALDTDLATLVRPAPKPIPPPVERLLATPPRDLHAYALANGYAW